MGLFTSLRRKASSKMVTDVTAAPTPSLLSIETRPAPSQSRTSARPRPPPSPRVAPLVATVGPSILRSNLPSGKSSRTSSPTRRRKASRSLRSATSSPSLATCTSSMPQALEAELDVTLADAASSPESSPYPATPLDLTPTLEGPPTFDDMIVAPSSPVLPRSPCERWTNCRAAALLAKPTFSPALSPVVSPTGSCFAGDLGGSFSPTFSYFAASQSTRPRRSVISFLGSDSPTSPVVPGSSTAVLLNSPIFDRVMSAAPIAPGPSCPPSVSSRLAERRPLKLDLSAATRRSRRLELDSAVLPSPVVALLKGTLAAAAPSARPPLDMTAMSTSLNQLEVSLRHLLETPHQVDAPLPHEKPASARSPLSLDAKDVKVHRSEPRRLSAVIEAGTL